MLRSKRSVGDGEMGSAKWSLKETDPELDNSTEVVSESNLESNGRLVSQLNNFTLF